MKFRILLITLVLTGTLSAQTSVNFDALRKKVVHTLLQQNSRSASGKKAPYPQLIAQSRYTFDGNVILSDTTTYFYSKHEQGAKFDFNTMYYGNAYYLPAEQPMVDVDFDGDSWRAGLNIVCDSSLQTSYSIFDTTANKVKYAYNGSRILNIESLLGNSGGIFTVNAPATFTTGIIALLAR